MTNILDLCDCGGVKQGWSCYGWCTLVKRQRENMKKPKMLTGARCRVYLNGKLIGEANDTTFSIMPTAPAVDIMNVYTLEITEKEKA